LTTYGAWQRAYPEVVCGLKRGFSYFPHEPGRLYEAEADRSNQLLVAASPNNELSDTHWLRSDVDHFLQKEAVAAGADYQDEVLLSGVEWVEGETAVLIGTREGLPFEARARLVIDATGPRGFPQSGPEPSGNVLRRVSANTGPLFALHERTAV